MERPSALSTSAILLSLLITLIVVLALYFQQVKQAQHDARQRLENHVQRLTDSLDLHFSQINLQLQKGGSLPELCSASGQSFRAAVLARPEIIGLQVVDRYGYLHCENQHRFQNPPHTGKPAARHNLRFAGPQLLNGYDGPQFTLARTRLDGSAIRVVLHPGWLRNQLRQLTSSLGFVALVNSDTGVPLMRVGSYSLPVQSPVFPLDSPYRLETLFDNQRQQFLSAQPLLTQPQLSIVISEESVLLDQPMDLVFPFWLGGSIAGFALTLMLVLRAKRWLNNPGRELRTAMRQHQFYNLYQPLVRSEDFSLAGVEVLMRWDHPEGTRSPDTFIPIAEQTGLIREMTVQQLQRITMELSSILIAQHSFRVSVNICPPIINDPATVEKIIAFKSRIPGLILEITENQMLEECEVTARSLQRFREAGISIAIDDFGTGYCGLAYLSQLPLHILKADRSFVAALGTDAVNADLLETIQQLAKKLDLMTVAEGVEEAEQAIRLQELGVELQQGWYHGRPMNSEKLYSRWLDSQQQQQNDLILEAVYG